MDADVQELQNRLITSEQQRIRLEQELRTLMSQSNRSERLQAMQLKSQMERAQSQREKSLQRNRAIRQQMADFDANVVNVSAQTQRLKVLKDEYEAYIERLYPEWKEKVIAEVQQAREKEKRLSSIKRDIDVDAEISARPASHHDSLSEIFREPDLAAPPGVRRSPDLAEPAGVRRSPDLRAAPGGHGSPLGVRRSPTTPPSPRRSATPELAAERRVARGERNRDALVSTSLTSEKSVTFDEASLHRKLADSDEELTRPDRHADRRDGPSPRDRARRPSPSQLLRLSRESSEASLRGSAESSPRRRVVTAVVEKPPVYEPPTPSMPATENAPLHLGARPSQADQPHYWLDESSDAPANQSSPPSPSVQSSLAKRADPPASSPPRVVIPSASADGGDSSGSNDADIDSLEEVIGRLANQAPSNPQPEKPTAGAGEPTVASEVTPPSQVIQSMSSLNSTAEEEKPPDVDITKTAEFRNLLAGSMPRGRLDDDSDGSEDSIEAVEKAYKQLSLNKTNTLPVGRSLTTTDQQAAPPSEEEEEEESDSLSAPMGYTPSFGTTGPTRTNNSGNVRGPSTSAAKDANPAATLPATSITLASSTGSSKGSSRRPAHLRTGSDIDSESDLDASVKKTNDNNNLETDFDFYG